MEGSNGQAPAAEEQISAERLSDGLKSRSSKDQAGCGREQRLCVEGTNQDGRQVEGRAEVQCSIQS